MLKTSGSCLLPLNAWRAVAGSCVLRTKARTTFKAWYKSESWQARFRTGVPSLAINERCSWPNPKRGRISVNVLRLATPLWRLWNSLESPNRLLSLLSLLLTV